MVRLHLQRLVGGSPRGPAIPWHSGPTFPDDTPIVDAAAAYVDGSDASVTVARASNEAIVDVTDAGGVVSSWWLTLRSAD